jgi:hypothetical protein
MYGVVDMQIATENTAQALSLQQIVDHLKKLDLDDQAEIVRLLTENDRLVDDSFH